MSPKKRSGQQPRQRKRTASVFLNIPYDRKFERLYLAYIAGISAFGLVPRATLEIPGGARRLDRIFSLIRECQFSVHDLSRVQLDRNQPRTPRFNMPFELGLCVAWEKMGNQEHLWFVCESVQHRLAKSLSDISGTDAYIHDGTVAGIFRELGNAFVRKEGRPSVQQIRMIYRILRVNLAKILRQAGAASPFAARVFKDLCVLASAAADEVV